jgi:uncharacterized protein (DUF849 family)
MNGGRTPAEHPAVPLTPEEQAGAAAASVVAGAGAIHVHVRGSDGRESLAAGDVARALKAIGAACPGVPVGVSTGAWISPDAGQRLSLVKGWSGRGYDTRTGLEDALRLPDGSIAANNAALVAAARRIIARWR